MKWKKLLIFLTSNVQKLVCTIQKSAILNLGIACFLFLISLSSCALNNCQDFNPQICYYPTERLIQSFPSAFPCLDDDELSTEWGKELYIGLCFTEEQDYYRALSSFKRARFLIPKDNERISQIEFNIVQAYYLGSKYSDALLAFDNSTLAHISLQFPALDELLLMLYDCYTETCQMDQALRILGLMEMRSPECAERMKLNYILKEADFSQIEKEAKNNEDVNYLLSDYLSCAKSPKKAQILNAIFPGAGYWYVGQHKAAFSSFIINALFAAAAYKFFDEGYWAAGLITAGIEAGWYFGGINGARLAAVEYNERLYECQVKDFMVRQRLFPILMFRYVF